MKSTHILSIALIVSVITNYLLYTNNEPTQFANTQKKVEPSRSPAANEHPASDGSEFQNQSIICNETNDLVNRGVEPTFNSQSDDLSKQVTQLKQKNQKLNDTYSKLKTEYSQFKAKVDLALIGTDINISDSPSSEITDEQLLALVPHPFGSFLTQTSLDQREKIYQFHQQDEDFDWGYQQQLNISDFIATHDLQNGIELLNVICKTDSCEIRIFEHSPTDEVWHRIMNDMRFEAWWSFNSTRSSSKGADDSNGLFTYVFASGYTKRSI